eukprot:192832-Karenia_brevis.AAC.1
MSSGGHIHTCAKAFANPTIDPSAFPSRSDLVSGFSRLAPKALGEGRLGGELFRLCPQLFAALYHPVAT